MTDFENFANREVISEADARDLRQEGVLAMDPERALPLWFDGRYLTARDLNREQNYFLSRQTTLGKAVGRGVVEGLDVTIDTDASAEGSRITISAGQGIAFDGAHILLPSDLAVDLADLAVQDALNAQLGLSATPGAPIRSRTGIFVLSLRAVEYTANPTASFPTNVTGERTTHMGDRIEAVAVTLTPYAPIDVLFDSSEARAMAAQRIFQGMEETGVPGHALPLAMLALRNGAIEWLDLHLARRDLVASRRNFLGLGLSRDQLRLSHFNQYQAALADVVASYRDRGLPARFNAEQHFRILPAAGPLPAACVDPAAQTQMFFPGEVEVELSIVPDDELPYLIDDSFELPPIDLTRPAAERDSLSVMVLAPLPRHVLRSQISQLGSLRRPLRPISLLGQGPQKPIDKLGTVRIALADVAAAIEAENTPATEAWAALIRALSIFGTGGDAAAPNLWYVRRRTLRENARLESALAAVDHLDAAADDDVLDPEAPAEPIPEAPEPDAPEPDAPQPEPPRPEPPRPEPPNNLDDEARALLLSLSGTGDLAKIIEAQMIRVTPSVFSVFKDGLSTPTIQGNPLAVTALTARIAAANANAVTNAKRSVEALAGANPKGMRLLSVHMIGETSVKVSAARFKELDLFVGNDLLERAAAATAKLGPAKAKGHIISINRAIGTGSADAVTAVVKAMVETAERPPAPPQPTAEDRAAAAARIAAANARLAATRRRADAQAKARAEALVRSLPDKAQQTAMRTLLGNADPTARDALVVQLERANIKRSRIATAAVISRLRTGGRLNTARLGKVRGINTNFVLGLAAMEPHLTRAPRPPARPPAAAATRRTSRRTGVMMAQPMVAMQPMLARANLAAMVAVAAETPVQKRIRLLSTNNALTALSNFGRKQRRSVAKLRLAAAKLIIALDARNATSVTVRAAILKATQGGR